MIMKSSLAPKVSDYLVVIKNRKLNIPSSRCVCIQWLCGVHNVIKLKD